MKSLFLLVLLVSWACGEPQLGRNGEVRSGVANMVSSLGKHGLKIGYHAKRASEVTKLDRLLKHVLEVHSHVRQAREGFTQDLAKASDEQSLLRINSEFQQWGEEIGMDLAYRRGKELHIKVNLAKAKDSQAADLVLQRLQEIDGMLTRPLRGTEKVLQDN